MLVFFILTRIVNAVAVGVVIERALVQIKEFRVGDQLIVQRLLVRPFSDG